MTSDQFWSWFTMPIGVMICFGAVVIAWLFSGPTAGTKKDPEDEH